MDKNDIQVFLKLKSYCDNLMQNPNADNTRKVAEVVNNNSNSALQYLSEYCLIPIITTLRINNIRLNIKEELVKTLRTVIQKSKIKKLKHFEEIYGSLLIQIFDKSQPNQVIMFHEELKEVVALCVKDLIHHSFTEVIELLYVKENKLKLGQGILLFLTIARTEKSSAVRLAAIDAVMALCRIDDEADKYDIILQDQTADTIMAFLPGIVSGFQEIAMGSETQNHKVTVMAVQAWGRIISLVMHDKEEEDTALSIEMLMKKARSASTDTLHTPAFLRRCDIKENLNATTRSQEWFEAVAIKLGTCIQLLDKIRSHSHYRVRRELVESISLILRDCIRNMKPNIMLLIDHLISLSEDESMEVSKKAHSALHIINGNYICDYNMRPLIDSLEERFYDLLTRLPTIVRWSDDNEQLASLNQLAGYIRLLGKQRLPHIMRSQAHIRRLLLALVYIMAIDCNDVSLLQTMNVKDLDDPAHFYGTDSWRQFKFIKSNSSKEKLIAICKLLGGFGDFRVLVDAILELMSDMQQHRKELTLLLNWILVSVSVKDTSTLHLYKEIMDFYTAEEIWYLPITVTEDTPLMLAQSNIIQCCFLTEGLGYIAQILQHDYDRYLLKTLYLVIERAGSGNGLISYIGVRTLETIAKAQQHEAIGDLLRANVDYFSYHIIIKLRHIERNPGVLDVVEVVMKYSKLDFLPYLKGIVEDVLRQLSVPFAQKNAYSFLKIFYTFIICIKTLMKQDNTKIPKEEDTTVINSPSETIILSLLEYYNAKKIDKTIEGNVEEMESNTDIPNIELPEETNEDISDSTEDKQEEEKLPAHVKIIVEVMKRCLHFLPSKDIQQSLMAMQTLQAGLPVLIEWENELLPIVHQMWHPLTERFNDGNILVINRAWQLLHVLADISDDFIRSRTLRQVLPSVFKFLTESSEKSINKNSTDIYKFTQIYKLQYELLSTLGLVARLLKLYERDLWEILSNTQSYLSARQNLTLQTCCVKLYKDIADYNGDVTWVKCLSIWNSKVRRIPSDATFDMKHLLNSDIAPSNEYCKNVKEIIIYIQRKNTLC